MSFIHLHVHSHYSLLDGLSKIDELIAEAKRYNMKAVALTDHGTMYGVIEFYQKAKEAGIKPIVGVEAYLAQQSRTSKSSRADGKPYHIILLAKNQQGYKNLIKLTSIAHLEGFYYKPRIDWEILERYSEGLICLTACIQGEIPQAIINKQTKSIDQLIEKYIRVFGKENFYLEIQHHPNFPEQKEVNRVFYKLAEKYKIGLVATNDCHYVKKEDAEIQDILLCLQTKKKKEDKDRMCMLDGDFSFRSPEQMAKDFKNHPSAIKNTIKIADQCNLKIELGKPKLPHYPLPKSKTADQILKDFCVKSLLKKYQKNKKEAEKRLKYELEIIKKTKFAPYFLIVQDFVNWAEENEIVVGPGRGSAAGSITSYLLGITKIDPLKYGLLFERFMTGQRISLPDIDLDFTDTRRDEVIHYVENKYGRDHVAQIITFGTMAARAAIRDVGRVLDVPYAFCDQLAKSVPFGSTLEQAMQIEGDLKNFYIGNKDAKRVIDAAKRLEGVARHASKHACGVVITPKPINEYTPTQYDVSGQEKTIITQYEMKSIEALGLLKMDFLGLKNLTIIENALKNIKYLHQEDIKVNKIPLDNQKTFDLLKKGRTIGVFQLESDGMRRYLKKLKPNQFDDIIAMVALYRPGPIQFIPDFIDGKQGKRTPHYLHPMLEPILESTYGVAIFQEQVLKIARDLAGFTLAEADVLRKAVGKKIEKLLKKQKIKFIEGCVGNKIEERTAQKIFAFIEPFARYGFNKSHATCYAMIAYHTAYLKANYPTEFMAALLSSDQNDSDRIALEVDEVRKMGGEVLPPDINESFKKFTVVGEKKIRFGLLAIKNVGKGIVENIIQERQKNGSFQNLEDFLSRSESKDLNKKSFEALIKCGAMDQFGERGQLLGSMDIVLDFTRKRQKDRTNGQTNLFGHLPEENKTGLRLKKVPLIENQQKLLWEKEFLGFFISEHPLQQYKKVLKKYTQPINELKRNQNVKILGIISKVKKIITNKKEMMVFVKMEDLSGSTEVIVFPKIFREKPEIWEENNIIFVSGRVSDKDGVLKILAETVKQVTKEKLDDLLIQSE